MEQQTTYLKQSIKIICFVAILNVNTGCSQQPPPTWNDIKNLSLHLTLDGVNFNVPLHYQAVFARDINEWPEIPAKIREGKERNVVDNIVVYALLPDLEPVTEKNKDDFTVLGWGRKLDAYITHQRSFKGFFEYHSKYGELERLPNSPEVLGMLHYKDTINQADIFLSHDYAVPELTFIECPYSKPTQYPHCTIETQYRYEISSNKNGVKEVTFFYLKYNFSRSYLPQWREIDRKLKALYDQFAQIAETQP